VAALPAGVTTASSAQPAMHKASKKGKKILTG